jgi:uncharacterized protein (UPF0332 family)
MNLSDLLSDGHIKKVKPDNRQAQECLLVAKRDLKLAKKLLGEDFDWTFSIAYNAMLQCARALMFADGYAAVGENHHKTAVDYADVKLGMKMREKIELFDDMRKKRHRVVYEKAGIVSEFEATHAVETAESFLLKIEEKIRGQK